MADTMLGTPSVASDLVVVSDAPSVQTDLEPFRRELTG